MNKMTMAHDFSVPTYCVGKKSGRVKKGAESKWVHNQQFVQVFLLEMDSCQFGVHDNHSKVLGSQIGLTQENPEISKSLEIINQQENQILILNICPTKFTIYLPIKISNGAPPKTEAKGLGGGIFVSLPKPKSYTQLQHKE